MDEVVKGSSELPSYLRTSGSIGDSRIRLTTRSGNNSYWESVTQCEHTHCQQLLEWSLSTPTVAPRAVTINTYCSS
ncbi:unnamed protein product [Boreogadus saida]